VLWVFALQEADNEIAILLETLPMRMVRMLPDIEETSAGSRVFPENPGILEPAFVFEAESSHAGISPLYSAH
jgi:hypothetical protein